MPKWLADIIPLLALYPSWVKWLISGWVLFTAGCVVALLVARPQDTANASANGKLSSPTSASNSVWLKIKGVEIYNARWRGAGVRVTAEVNGNSYTYPSIGGVQWLVAGPDMSPGLFRLPPSETFQITFSMEAKHQGMDDLTRLVSQRTIIVRKDQLPRSETYAVHELGRENTRAPGISAEISFTISNQPD